jgi:SAM-dependent methyltransferase
LAGPVVGHDGAVSEAPIFYSRPSLNVETYDSRVELEALGGDVEFYRDLAGATGGPVLDLGGGTGRVAWPLAEAGFDVTNLDLSAAMLAKGREKSAGASGAARRRLTFVEADMRGFALDGQFGLAITPARSFQALLTAADQRAALASIHRHLRPGGVLVVQVFDPLLDYCLPMDGPSPNPDRGTGILAGTGHRVQIRVLRRTNDPLAQVFTELWEFVELDAAGAIVRREEERLQMRWSYRYEMRYLLELSGFAVDAEFSDFHRAPPRYGAEQVWLARRPH